MRRHSYLVLLLLIAILFGSCSKGVDFLTIGTGGVTGVYYPTGGAISKMINRNVETIKIKATPQSTQGSIFNINAVLRGDLDMGIAQSDAQYSAFYGQGPWEKTGPQKSLRSIFSLHSESVTVIVSDNSGINSIEDMRGKRIAIGAPGSGNRQNALDALLAYGLSPADVKTEDLKPAECAGTLQDGRIDGYFYTVGHPNGSIKEAVAGATKVHFVPVTRIDSLLLSFPFYARSVIPIDEYSGVTNTANVPSFAVKATMITVESIPEDVIYRFVQVIFANFDEFVTKHPAFQGMTKEGMLEGMTAPLHPGALRYYREVGLIKVKSDSLRTDSTIVVAAN